MNFFITLKFHYQMENTSEVMVIEDTEAIRTLKEAVNGAEKNERLLIWKTVNLRLSLKK